MKRPNTLFRLHPDELTTNSREIQDETSHNLPHNDMIFFGLAPEGKSSYLIGWPADSRAPETLRWKL